MGDVVLAGVEQGQELAGPKLEDCLFVDPDT